MGREFDGGYGAGCVAEIEQAMMPFSDALLLVIVALLYGVCIKITTTITSSQFVFRVMVCRGYWRAYLASVSIRLSRQDADCF